MCVVAGYRRLRAGGLSEQSGRRLLERLEGRRPGRPHGPRQAGGTRAVQWAIVSTGNSFAAPHVAGLLAGILVKHPHLTLYEVEALLRTVASNAEYKVVTVVAADLIDVLRRTSLPPRPIGARSSA